MDENPYKAPQTEGGTGGRGARFPWRRLLELVLLMVGTIIGVSLIGGILVLIDLYLLR